ncbi:MAG: signal peptide peptidase SppA [Phenylobacterium sp.]
MKQFFITMAGVFAGLVVFAIAVPFLLVVAAASAARPDPLPARAVLELDLRQGLTDQDAPNPLLSLGRQGLSVMGVVDSLRKAEQDDRVKAVLVRLPEGGIEPAAADELRLALKRFRAAGKPVYAHSQGIYPSGMVTSTYMLGAAANEFWMQPAASLQVTGLTSEDIFFKRALDKYGLQADFQQRYEYKNAVNPYLYSDYTPQHREAQLSWMGSVYRSALFTAAADRGKDPAGLQRSLEAGPYQAEEAHRLGLIDRIGQVKDAEQALIKQAGDGARLVEFEDYQRRERRAAHESGPAIGVIEAEGPIVTGRDGIGNPLTGSSTIYADEISEAIYDAIEDDDIKAIVFRVNSPGGSDTASEQIAAAVRAAKAAGKPVVVSMGTYAASGGYWISAEASSIVAEPTSLTGSIGVFGGKLAVGPALQRFGVDIRETSVGGSYADAFALGQAMAPDDQAAFGRWMDQIYENFVARVAAGRKLPVERVREIAKGRIWTGAQARQLGLVDEVGGFYQAVEKAKALAGLKGETNLKRMSPRESPFEAIEHALGVSATSARTLAAAAWLLGDPKAEAVLDEVARARMGQSRTTVLAPTPVR